MYAVEVAPIQRGVLKDSLTFFSRDALPQGAIVSAPIRNRMVPALVISVADVREQKLDLKASGFSLKKLGVAEPRPILSAAFMRGVRATAEYHAASVGAVFAQLSFASLIQNGRKLESPVEVPNTTVHTKPEVLILQAEYRDRVHSYRNMVREAFARGRSVLLLAPTLIEVEELKRELGRGIEDRVVAVSSAQTPKSLKTAWARAAKTEDGLLVIGTPPALSYPLPNIDVIALERESARSYVTRTRPMVDTRHAAEFCAKEIGARFVLADFPLRAETFARSLDGTVDDVTRPSTRSTSGVRVQLVDSRTTDEMKAERRRFSSLQRSTVMAIQEALERKEHVVVFAARRGIAPLTVCNDCGTPVVDPATGVPMVLHKTPKGNVFVSHRSGALLPASRPCATCGGWNLVTLGIGVDRVMDDLKAALPKAKIISFVKETAETHREAKRVADSFYKAESAILVGTERMLPYITQKVPLSVVASIDSTLSLPAWRASEHALAILFGLLGKTSDTMIVETRKPDNGVMKAIESLSPMECVRDEVRERRTFGYPPFKTFIGLTWTGTAHRTETLRELVKKEFSDYDLVGPLPPESVDKGRTLERAVIRVEPRDWPNQGLAEKLQELPPDIVVSVDPDDIV